MHEDRAEGRTELRGAGRAAPAGPRPTTAPAVPCSLDPANGPAAAGRRGWPCIARWTGPAGRRWSDDGAGLASLGGLASGRGLVGRRCRPCGGHPAERRSNDGADKALLAGPGQRAKARSNDGADEALLAGPGQRAGPGRMTVPARPCSLDRASGRTLSDDGAGREVVNGPGRSDDGAREVLLAGPGRRAGACRTAVPAGDGQRAEARSDESAGRAAVAGLGPGAGRSVRRRGGGRRGARGTGTRPRPRRSCPR